MAYFVIVGTPDCSAFVHGVYVARYLQDRLPNFSAHIIQKKTIEWESWLENTNWKNEWHHSNSPIIWKEISMRGGIPHYVGGLSEFWEYCYDYYGLESLISPEDVRHLVADNMQYLKEKERVEEEKLKNIRYVSIVGLYHPAFPLLLSELLQLQDLEKTGGICFSLYDIETNFDETVEYIDGLLEDIAHLIPTGNVDNFKVVDKRQDLVVNCDLLIVLGDFTRKKDELEIDWLVRNMSAMFIIADVVNVFAKRTLQIVLAVDGPVCYDANVLIDTCTAIRIQNIVAVTSDVGLGPLREVAEKINAPLSSLAAPPVWGYIGVNQFVDIESVVMCCDVYRPYQRILRNKGGSTLPLGEIEQELRYIAYLIDNTEEIENKSLLKRKAIEDKLNRQPTYAKVRSTVSLLKLWYSKKPSDAIISLGVCSNGAHEIPRSLVFSQPVILENNLWTPVKNFPLTTKSKREIKNLIPLALEAAEKMSVGPYSTGTSTYSGF